MQTDVKQSFLYLEYQYSLLCPSIVGPRIPAMPNAHAVLVESRDTFKALFLSIHIYLLLYE